MEGGWRWAFGIRCVGSGYILPETVVAAALVIHDAVVTTIAGIASALYTIAAVPMIADDVSFTVSGRST